MKDGTYDLVFSANGCVARGSLLLDGRRARASGSQVHLEGNFGDVERNLTAVFDVLMPRCVLRNARIPERYSLQMSGTGSDHQFDLIGIGPLGLIVEIAGWYREPAVESRRLDTAAAS